MHFEIWNVSRGRDVHCTKPRRPESLPILWAGKRKSDEPFLFPRQTPLALEDTQGRGGGKIFAVLVTAKEENEASSNSTSHYRDSSLSVNET